MFRIVMKTIMAPILIVLTMMVVITIKKEKCHCQFPENPHLLKMPFCAVTCDLLALEDHQERRSRVAQKEKAAFVITTPSTAVL